MSTRTWKRDLVRQALDLLDGHEHPVASVIEKLSAEDLDVLVGRLRNRLRAEAEAGEVVGAVSNHVPAHTCHIVDIVLANEGDCDACQAEKSR